MIFKHGSVKHTLQIVVDLMKNENLIPTKPIMCYDSVSDIPTDVDTYEYLVGYDKYQVFDDATRKINDWSKAKPTDILLVRSTYKEAEKTLIQFAEKKIEKYPLIFVDSPSIKFTRNNEEYFAEIGTVIIAVRNPDAISKEDVREVQTFEPLLRPILNSFIDNIDKLGLLKDKNYRVIEHLFFGSKTETGYNGNLFGDFVDAIEINNLKIRVLNNC